MELTEVLSGKYLGRFFALGLSPSGYLTVIYCLTGRSDPSKNRILENVPGKDYWLQTNVFDKDKSAGNKKLTIYHAIALSGSEVVVSNGNQTDAVMMRGMSGLSKRIYEPDQLSTPRITGIADYVPGGESLKVRIVLLKRAISGDKCDRADFRYHVPPGTGRFISTYQGHGDLPLSFKGEPLVVPITSDNSAEIAETWWSALSPDNRVALAARVLSRDYHTEICIKNMNLGD